MNKLKMVKNNKTNKKAMGAVVATALIIVVAVVAVMAFQNWFMSYQTSLNVKAESQSTESMSTQIDTMVGSTIFIKNGYENLSINSVKVDGEDCNVTDSLTSGMQTLDVSGCLDNLTTKTPEVVIVTDKGVFSKTIYIKDANVTYTPTVASLNCSTLGLSGGEWITVPGNVDLGTTDFCVMKYEAKWDGTGTIFDSTNKYCGNGNIYNVSTGCLTDGSIGVTSVALGRPLTNVNQFEAIALCNNLGPNYKLISDLEWVTIARNAEQVSNNWFGSVVGTNFIYSGHNDYGMDGGVNNAVSLDASSDDNNGYYRTGDSLTSCDNSYYNFVVSDETTSGRACAGQRRTLSLSNGNVIWDLSGNVWEWTDDTFTTAQSSLGQSVSNWYEWDLISGYDYLESGNSLYNATFGIGRVYADVDASWPTDATWNAEHAFLRGGLWNHGAYAGVFALYLTNGPTSSYTNIGFRCVYEP